MNYSDVIYMMTRRFPSPYLEVLYALQSIYLFFSSTLNYSNFNGNCLYRDLKSDIIILQTFPLALMSEDREVWSCTQSHTNLSYLGSVTSNK